MLAGRPIGAFVATTDAERSRAFYEGILGLPLLRDDGFALVFDCAGTLLRVSRVETLTPQPFTVLGWQVDDIAAAVDALAAQGVDCVRYDFLQPDERGIVTFPGGDRVAWFQDPDGNLLSLTQAA